MKFRPWISLCLALGFATAACAQLPRPYRLTVVNSAPVSPAAREALDAINEQFLWLGPQPSEFWKGRTHTQNAQMREDAQQRIRELALKFYAEHPTDPLRWVAIQQMLMNAPRFITGYKPGYDESERANPELIEFDVAKQTAWTAELARYEAALEAATDVPWEIHERRAFLKLSRVVAEAARSGAAAIGTAERKIDAHAARFPEGESALALYQSLHRVRLKESGSATEELWGRLAASSNRQVATRADAELRKIETGRKPLELAFTAVDGRAVDLAALRGKVVLIDFWATWCGPCIAELPNIKQVYAAYHDKGFEIVGIALENAKFADTDTPDQREAKLAAARQVLTDFTAKNEMPWPQHFDGQWWKNEFARRYAVNSIPAMFLLGKDGKVVTTNARGEKLEAEVKRLLGL